MFCRNCGKELSDGAFLCPDCGEPTAAETRASSTLSNQTEREKPEYFAVAGFTGSMISIASWVLYLVIVICGYYLTAMTVISGIVTGFICMTSLFLSIKGVTVDTSGKNRALAIAGIVLSAAFFTGFALLTCIYGVLYY